MQYLPQLIELLPHVSRVVPAADKYLAQRNASDAKLDTLSSSLHTDLGRVARAHVDMATQLDAFAAQVTLIGIQAREAATEAARARAAAESVEARLTRSDKAIAVLRTLLVFTLVLLAITLALVAILITRPH